MGDRKLRRSKKGRGGLRETSGAADAEPLISGLRSGGLCGRFAVKSLAFEARSKVPACRTDPLARAGTIRRQLEGVRGMRQTYGEIRWYGRWFVSLKGLMGGCE